MLGLRPPGGIPPKVERSAADPVPGLRPAGVTTEALFGFHVPGLGIILTLAILIVTGAFAANFFGRKLLLLGDAAVGRIPIVRSIYGGVKQISDTLFSSEGQAFRRAV